MSENTYRGRFAPSPTGPLHFGSLVAAVGSYLQARVNNGEWFLRIENIDPPREPEGASQQIIHTLEHFGFEWDGPILYQHDRLHDYENLLNELSKTGRLYQCSCSRKKIALQNKNRTGPLVYPGTCRNKTWCPGKSRFAENFSLRLDTRNVSLNFNDAIQGIQKYGLEHQGDYVIRRADGLYSYLFAVAIDDAQQGITEVVRGADLLACTARQIYLQQLLNLPTPDYAHLPLAHDPQTGQKLSKQNGAPAIKGNVHVALLWYALKFLGQAPDKEIIESNIDEIWNWAIKNWKFKFVPKTADIEKELYKVC